MPIKYEYLNKYKDPELKFSGICNAFYPLSEEQIINAEKRIGFKFPSELRKFYEEIGYGFLQTSHNTPKDYEFYGFNYIESPQVIADIMLNGIESGYIIDSTLNLLVPGDLPFFEMYDSSYFMIIKLNSNNPNAVWTDTGIKIEDSFQKFIWRLYHESPDFYGDVIAANCPPAKPYTPPIEPSNPLEALWEGYENGGKYAGKSYFLKTLCCRQSFDELLLTIQQLPRERVSTISLMFNALIKEALSRSDLIKEECKELLNCLRLKQEE